MRTTERQAAIDLLREDYHRQVAELVPVLKAWDLSGLSEDQVTNEAGRFEKLCRSKACRTVAEARLTFAFAAHWDDAYDGGFWDDIRDNAALAMALDVAHLAGARWFIQVHTEPSNSSAPEALA